MTSIKRISAVTERTSLCKSTIYRLIRDGLFPAPVKLGIRTVGWLESDLDEWISQRVNQSCKANQSIC